MSPSGSLSQESPTLAAMSRIIAGSHKGRRLVMPAHSRTRPTTDRVREAAFSLIADWAGTAGVPATDTLAGLGFLDLYAGSAGVALEAASRGAAPVSAVERDPATAEVARRNVRETGLDVKVVPRSVAGFLASQPVAFDVVWADPPYDLDAAAVDQVIAEVVAGGWLAAHGLVIVERSGRDRAPLWPADMEDSWHRVYGETTLHFAMKGDE